MPSTYLPETDHVVRIIPKPANLMWNDDKTAAIGIFPQAFVLRGDEDNLSVSWLEHFSGSKNERMKQVRDHAELTLKPRSGLAVLNVGELKGACEACNVKVRVIHEPTSENPAHAGIHRYPREHNELFPLLANIAAADLTLNRDIT